MKKQTLGHQSNHVTKSERVENLWKKLIRQETDLSDETITWMTRRIRLLTEYMAYGCALIAYRKQNGDFIWQEPHSYIMKPVSIENTTLNVSRTMWYTGI